MFKQRLFWGLCTFTNLRCSVFMTLLQPVVSVSAPRLQLVCPWKLRLALLKGRHFLSAPGRTRTAAEHYLGSERSVAFRSPSDTGTVLAGVPKRADERKEIGPRMNKILGGSRVVSIKETPRFLPATSALAVAKSVQLVFFISGLLWGNKVGPARGHALSRKCFHSFHSNSK